MKLSLLRGAAAAAIAAAAFLAVPTAAQATPTYPETPAPGVTAPVGVPAGVFLPGEDVDVLLSGEDANFASVAVVRGAYVANANIGTVTSEDDGSLNHAITYPSTATGAYVVTHVSESGRTYTQTVTPAAGGTGGGGTGGGDTSGPGLAVTGMDSSSLLGLWVGGGALVLAGGAVAVAAAVRRQRQNADA